MVEEVETTFIAYIRYGADGKPAPSIPGVELGAPIAATGPAAGSDATGATPASPLATIPIARRMCFRLAADKADFRIVPNEEICPPDIQQGNIKFAPQWKVTPLRAGTLHLELTTTLFINKQRRDHRQEPWPLKIEVKGKPSLWDWLDGVIKRATATVKLTVGLAESLGALFAVVAAWGIWSLFKRSKRKARTRKTTA